MYMLLTTQINAYAYGIKTLKPCFCNEGQVSLDLASKGIINIVYENSGFPNSTNQGLYKHKHKLRSCS